MGAGAGATAGAAGAAAVVAQAIKASGVIVRVDAGEFSRIIDQHDEPLVVHATGGFFTTKHLYLASYRGLAFFAKSDAMLPLPGHCQLVEAQKIWIPG